MSLDNYADLQTSVLNWMARESDQFITARVPDFIALFETNVVTDLRVREMELVAPLTLTANIVPLPSNYLEMRRISLQGSFVSPIEYVTPQVMDEDYGVDNGSGSPTAYTIVGQNLIFAPAPAAPPQTTLNAQLTYYGFSPLSAAAPVNWLLTKYPNAYLYGALAEAVPWSDDPTDQTWAARRDQVMEKIMAADSRAEHPGTLQMRRYGSTP